MNRLHIHWTATQCPFLALFTAGGCSDMHVKGINDSCKCILTNYPFQLFVLFVLFVVKV